VIARAPKFFVGDEVRVKNRPPGMSSHAGLIRRLFRPTPDKERVWRYLVIHKGQQVRQGKWTKAFVHAYNETDLELNNGIR
jgi:hypothetical protein